MPNSGIFISYRRDDAAGHAGWLREKLATHFGQDEVFMDLGLHAGMDFVEPIEAGISGCAAMVVVIGPEWLTTTGADGRRRLDDEGDPVRLEVATALAHPGLRVIPVLVDGARMPDPEELPEDLEPLARRQAIELTNSRWEYDVGRLSGTLERVLGAHATPFDRQQADRAPEAPPTFGAASDPDLLERLLGAEAGGTITRARAGRTAHVSRRRPPEAVMPARLPEYVPEPEPEPAPAGNHDEWSMRRVGLPRSSRLLLIALALAGAGGVAAAIIRWLIGGVVIPPADADTADDIDVTVFSPVHAAPGDALLVQVFAHLPAQAGHARALATEFDADTSASGFTSLSLPVPPGAELGFELRAPGLDVDEGSQRLVWRRRAQSVQFGVTVPVSAQPGTRIATLIVSRDSIPVGHVKFKLTVEPRLAPSAGMAPAGEDARTYERTFASYAREDIHEVLRRVQVLRHKRLTRLRLFQDILDIDPGERWRQRLHTEIDNCDIVLLFWSTAAHDSEWVRREVRYALARRVTEYDPPEIIPVIIEMPPCTPWPELADHHFDDHIARLIAEL
jgi:hypothetical protein